MNRGAASFTATTVGIIQSAGKLDDSDDVAGGRSMLFWVVASILPMSRGH